MWKETDFLYADVAKIPPLKNISKASFGYKASSVCGSNEKILIPIGCSNGNTAIQKIETGLSFSMYHTKPAKNTQ